jgi:Trk K+ transport system NAD-binding subunit
MCDAGRLDNPDEFQRNGLNIQVIEQADAFSKQKRRYIEMDRIHQAQVETLLENAGRADRDILIACSF